MHTLYLELSYHDSLHAGGWMVEKAGIRNIMTELWMCFHKHVAQMEIGIEL